MNLGLAEQIARRDRRRKRRQMLGPPTPPRITRENQIIDVLRTGNSVRMSSGEAVRILPALKPRLEQTFPGKRAVYERGRVSLKDSGGSFLGGLAGVSRTLRGDVAQIGTGIAQGAAEYGGAFYGDITDIRGAPFKRTGRLVGRDVLGAVGLAETAIPEPSFLPEWMRREVIEVDPEKLTIRRGSGEIDPTDVARAGKFWREDPLIGALLVTPAVGAVARAGSRGALAASIRAANPNLTKRQARRIARRESRLPGFAAAQGVEGGIAPRIIKGEFGEAPGRPYSRHPTGRGLQRAYDRASALLEQAVGPGAKFTPSQRAARMTERGLRKSTNRRQAEIARLERAMRRGIGLFGRARADQEALIAVLEAPRGLTPRQAVEIKLADLRSTIERPRTAEDAQARILELDRQLERGLRPLVDREFPVAGRQREQALRNVQPRGKRARRAVATELEMTGIRGSREAGGSVLADAYAQIEARILEAAEKPDADPTVRTVAAKITERDRLRAEVSDPEVVFGEAVGEYGITGATPAAARRLKQQVQALERALKRDNIDSEDFAAAVEAAERLSARADEAARTVLGMSDDELASRRNLIALRYAEKGLLPEGVEPEARGFFPHRGEYETVAGRMGAPTLAATGGVVGRPVTGREFEHRQNQMRLYERGEVQTDPRVLSNLVRQRERFLTNVEARSWLYAQGSPVVRGQPIREGSFIVRNPETAPTDIPASVRAAIENPQRYSELVSRAGGYPEPETFQQWLGTWLYRGEGPEPEWLADVENVRVVPEGVVRTLLADVFRSAPRGSVAAIFGSLNALARAATIYLPYGGVRYVLRNTPQNMILLALTQPKAFLNLRQSVWALRREHPDIYDAVKVEAGTVPAAAGLPELAGRRYGLAQRAEERMTAASRRIAGGLGELSDEPWRVASWLAYGKAYGFSKPADLRRLLDSDEPEVARVRDDIAQRVRDDMIDFDALSPFERESLSRFLFIYPFVRGALKWPFMYLREHPERAAILSLIAAQHEREGDPAQSVYEEGQVDIGGVTRNLGWLDPTAPARSTIEGVVETARAIPESPQAATQAFGGAFLAPQYAELVRPYGDWRRTARSFAPGLTTAERIGRGGDFGEQALRMLGATVELRPSAVDKRRTALEEDMRRIGRADAVGSPYLARAFDLQAELSEAVATKESTGEKAVAALQLAGQKKLLPPTRVQDLIARTGAQTDDMNELLLGRISDHLFGGLVLTRARSTVNEELRRLGLEPAQ
jgi:hypothetical protein